MGFTSAEVGSLKIDNTAELKAEIARLQAELKSAQAVCDSYAKENQQFSDTIDRLRAALEEISKLRNRGDMGWTDRAALALDIADKALVNEQLKT